MERPTSLDLEEKQERDYNCLQRPHRRTDPRRTELHSDDDALSEETPLLGNGTRNVVPDGKQDSSTAAGAAAVETANPGAVERLESQLEAPPWSLPRQAKVSFLFLLVIGFSIMFAVYPELEYQWNLATAFTKDINRFNVSSGKDHMQILKVFARAKFLYKYPSERTDNMHISVLNPLSSTVQNKTWVLATDSKDETPEIIESHTFDFSGETIPDFWLVEMTSNIRDPQPVDLSFLPLSSKVNNAVIYAALILVGVYLLIIFEVIHRTLAAMIGAVIALAVLAEMGEKPSLEGIMEWLDYETLVLLFGMMIVVSIFVETGVFDWIALKAFVLTSGKTWPLITMLCVFGAVVSAFLDNVTTILLLTPVTIRLSEALGLNPIHILIAEVLFSNIGGTATAIGDPPNVLIVGNVNIANAGINFGTFTLHMSVGCVFVALAAYALLRFMYRNRALLVSRELSEVAELRHEIEIWKRAENSIAVASREESTVKALLKQKVVSLENILQQKVYREKHKAEKQVKLQIAEMEKRYRIRDPCLLLKCSIVLAVIIVMFFLSSFVESLYVSVGLIPLLGSVWLIVLSDHSDLDSVLHRIEWATLLFFAALFVLMEALAKLGLIDEITVLVSSVIEALSESARLPVAILIIQWASALASSFIDNIPFTTAMLPVILNLAGDTKLNLPLEPMVWALAFGACLGGNGTLIGSSCNVVCAGIAETHGHRFSFYDFFRVGFPMMVATNVVASVYLLLCHVVFSWH